MSLKVYFQAWDLANSTDKNLIINVERKLDCCGRGIDENNTPYPAPTAEDHKWSIDHNVFADNKTNPHCYSSNATVMPTNCHTCLAQVQPKMEKAFRGAGGLGLFFSFPEVRTLISNVSCVTEFNIMTSYQF